MINTFFHKLLQWCLYSSVRKFVITDTEENGENWYMTNNNQFTVLYNSCLTGGINDKEFARRLWGDIYFNSKT